MKVTVKNIHPGVATIITTVELEPGEVRSAQIALWRAVTRGGHHPLTEHHIMGLYLKIKAETGIGSPDDRTTEPIVG